MILTCMYNKTGGHDVNVEPPGSFIKSSQVSRRSRSSVSRSVVMISDTTLLKTKEIKNIIL